MADRDMRYVIARSFGLIGDTRAKNVLTRFLGDEDCDVVREAARSLGRIGEETAVGPLLQKIQKLILRHNESYCENLRRNWTYSSRTHSS